MKKQLLIYILVLFSTLTVQAYELKYSEVSQNTKILQQTLDTLIISKLRDKQWLSNYPKKGLTGTKFEYIQFNDNSVLKVGDELIIGTPSSSKQTNEKSTGLLSSTKSTQSNFSFIISGRMGMAALVGTNYLPDNWRGEKVIINSITMYQDKRGGGVSIVIKEPTVIERNIEIYATIFDIEKALEFGEIVNPKATITSDQALAELKKAKDKLDLGLITQEEYDKIKEELFKYIK